MIIVIMIIIDNAANLDGNYCDGDYDNDGGDGDSVE